jgi:hypothetical protein
MLPLGLKVGTAWAERYEDARYNHVACPDFGAVAGSHIVTDKSVNSAMMTQPTVIIPQPSRFMCLER